MIRELRAESPTLTELNDKFRHVAKDIDILTCYELCPTKTAIKVFSELSNYYTSTNDDISRCQMGPGNVKVHQK